MSSDAPRVSGVIIFLNGERFIEEAIASVFAQTFDDWELLLVDDGSTDRSSEIAKAYAAKHPERVRYLEHPGHENRGMGASRNLGVANARGAYVAFLDADDIWLPHKLEEQVALLDLNPDAVMLYGRTRYWFSWTGEPEDAARDSYTETSREFDTIVQPPTQLLLFLQDDEFYPCTCSMLVRREVFERVGGFEETFRDTYEDMVFHSKVFLNYPVYVSSECWDWYRQHPDSCWAKTIEEGRWHAEEANVSKQAYLEWLESYLLDRGRDNGEVWNVLQRELLPYRHPGVYRQVLIARKAKRKARRVARRVIPAPARRRLRIALNDGPRAALSAKSVPPVGHVRAGDLRRLTPISAVFGFDRGQPIDRYYIENFLALHAEDIRGRCLEIADDTYLREFGGPYVTRRDVLHIYDDNPLATIVGDLQDAPHIPDDTFDCVVLTQTLHLIFDMPAAMRTLHRILKPGGVLLMTTPGISQIDSEEWGGVWHWGLTPLSARRLTTDAFPGGDICVESHGNVFSAVAFLHGLAVHELTQEELDYRDSQYPVIVTVRAQKAGPVERAEG